MNIEYCLMEKEMEGYKAYGIAAIQEQTVADYVSDISIDKEMVKNMVVLFNRNQLCLEHFRDVILDLIS
ncbi:MAG: hypothetical protein HFE39_08160 [Clostridiales bacterium]|nr:hypothetical protein [Clostridiales bacterium]